MLDASSPSSDPQRVIDKQLFLSLTRRQNGLGWLELRSFVAVQGQLLFGDQELPILWMVLLTVALSVIVVYRAFFVAGDPNESILFNGLLVLMLICDIALFRLFLTAQNFEALQALQEKLLSEQKFYLRCHAPFADNEIVDSAAVGYMDHQRSQHSLHNFPNPLHKDSIVFMASDEVKSPFAVDAMVMKDGATTKSEAETGAGAEVELVEVEEAVSADEVDDAEEDADAVVVPLKVNEDEKEKEKEADDNENADEAESEPLLRVERERSKVLSVVREKVVQIEDTNRYAYSVSFVDDLILLVRKKDIFPRLFKLKLAGFLSKILTALLVAVVATGFRLYNGASQ